MENNPEEKDFIEVFADRIINGTAGFKQYENCEIVVYPDRTLGVAEFVIRCLGNVKCEGSEEVVEALVERHPALLARLSTPTTIGDKTEISESVQDDVHFGIGFLKMHGEGRAAKSIQSVLDAALASSSPVIEQADRWIPLVPGQLPMLRQRIALLCDFDDELAIGELQVRKFDTRNGGKPSERLYLETFDTLHDFEDDFLVNLAEAPYTHYSVLPLHGDQPTDARRPEDYLSLYKAPATPSKEEKGGSHE